MNWEGIGQRLLLWGAQFGARVLGAVLLKDYWQVYFDTNRLIRDSFGEAGFPAPEHYVLVRDSLGDTKWGRRVCQGFGTLNQDARASS